MESVDIENEYNEGYNQGYEDALRWIIECTNGDNYKDLALKNLRGEFTEQYVTSMEF